MATFVKDVLYPGSYWVSDGKGGKKKVAYSRKDVEHLRQRMEEMLAAGLSIPLAAEHQDKAKPLTKEERQAEWIKKLTMGWAEQAEIAPEGFLTARVQVPVEEDARRLPAVRFVSPEIVNDFVDGSGRLWEGPSITHLAVTARPVNVNQKPFQPVRMSVIRLSLADFQGESMAEERENKEGKEGGEREGNGDGLDLKALRELLEGDGYAVPEQFTEPAEFLKHLHTAAMSKKALIDKLIEDEDEDEEEEEEPEEAGESGGELPPGVAPENGPVLMSLGGHKFQISRVRNPSRNRTNKGVGKKIQGKKAPVQLSHGVDPRTARLEQALLSQSKERLQGRIAALYHSGRITKPIHDTMLLDLGTVRLSLDDSGQLASNAVIAKVEAYEALPAGSAWPTGGTLPANVGPAPEPGAWGGYETAQQVAQAVDDFFGMLPGAAAAKKK